MTNYREIVQMSVEELANFLRDIAGCFGRTSCDECMLEQMCVGGTLEDWLYEEVSNG